MDKILLISSEVLEDWATWNRKEQEYSSSICDDGLAMYYKGRADALDLVIHVYAKQGEVSE